MSILQYRIHLEAAAMEVWIQSADLTSRDLGDLTAGEAITAFRSIDWTLENDRLAALLATNVECCPPGMGLVAGDGHILHLMPQENGGLRWVFDRPTGGSFWVDLLGGTSVDARGLMTDAAELIEMAYEQKFEKLWRRSRASRGT